MCERMTIPRYPHPECNNCAAVRRAPYHAAMQKWLAREAQRDERVQNAARFVQQQRPYQGALLGAIARRGEESEAIPQATGKREFDEAQGLMGALGALARHPFDVPAGVAAESLPASMPALALGAVGSIAGPGGTAAGAGLGSFVMEYGGAMLDALQSEGYDLRRPDTLAPLLADAEKLGALREKAVRRGIPVALFDAVSAGIAGRVLRTPARSLLGKAGQGAAEIGIQGVLGGAGEVAGAVAAGEAIDPKAVLAEMLGEVGTGTVKVATGAIRDRALGARKLDTGQNVPEARATLAAQQEQLVRGLRPAQMFPVGTEELPLPKGMQRMETERGVFHFDPRRVTADEILTASRRGRENDVLALGSWSKADVDQRVARGEERVAVTERTPDGTEVKTAVSTRGGAADTAAVLAATRTPGNVVAMEPVEQVVRERLSQAPGEQGQPGPVQTPAATPRRNVVEELLAREARRMEEEREARAREAIAREQRQRELAEKQARFDERVAVAREVMRRPAATFAEVNGALESVRFYAEDNSLGLAQEQREIAARASAALGQRLAGMQAAEQARREAEQRQREELARAEEALKRERVRAQQAEVAQQAAAGIGVSGRFDYAAAPIAALEQRAEQGDQRAIEAIARRSESENAGETREELLSVLREVKLPASDAALGAELGQLIREGMTPQQRMELVSRRETSLDQTAEALRERGFAVDTPNDVLDAVSRALRGGRIYASAPPKVDFATERSLDAKLAEEWREVAGDAAAFQFGRTEGKTPAEVAHAISTPESRVLGASDEETGEVFFTATRGDRWGGQIRLREIRPGVWEADALQARPAGAQLYQAAMTWAHNNGHVLRAYELSPINRLRRTSNMLSSTLRHGTTRHLEPAQDQGIDWRPAGDDHNIAAMARREAELVAERLPATAEWSIDPDDGTIRDKAGRPIDANEIDAALRAEGGPARHGVGPATLRRALLTRRLDAEQPGFAHRLRENPALRPAARGVLYARGGGAGGTRGEGVAELPARPAGLTESEIEREIAAIRKAAPRLVRTNDLEIGDVRAALRERAAQDYGDPNAYGKVPDAVQAALVRRRNGQRTLIALSARAYRDRRKGAGLIVHEVAHAFWDAMPGETLQDLREMHAREVATKSGPLYRDGELLTELDYVEDMDERGHKEWFSERMARLHEDWLKERIDLAEKPLLRRLAHQIRLVVQRVWAALARADGADPDSRLFIEGFRRFFESGASPRVGRIAGAAWAQARTPQLAREDRAIGAVEFATEGKDPGKDPRAAIEEKKVVAADDVGALEARYEQLREEFDRASDDADKIRAEMAPLWESQEQDAEVRLRALNDSLTETERHVKNIYTRLTALRKQIDQAKPTKATLPAGKTPAQVIAEAARVEALPKVDRKAALLAELKRGRALRDEGSANHNEATFAEGIRIAKLARERLDEEFPGWDREEAANERKRLGLLNAGLGKERGGTPAAEPVPSDESDREKAPFAEPEKDMPVRTRKTAEIYGHTSYKPAVIARSWERVRDALRGIKGSVPELPTFSAAWWNQTDSFIREHGPHFYDGIKAFYRKLVSANDGIHRQAEDDVAKITKPLIEAGGRFQANDYARLKRLQERVRRLTAEQRRVPASVESEIAALNSKLESHPYVLFERLVLMLDLNWRHQNLKDSEGNPIKLPAGINEAELKAELQRLAARIAASDHEAQIRTALEEHMALVKRVAEDLKQRELMAVDALQNPFYFPHLTLEVTRGGKTEQRELRPARVKPDTEADFRGYLVDPVGSTKAIETDYVSAMYYHLVQVGAHNANLLRNLRDMVRASEISQAEAMKAGARAAAVFAAGFSARAAGAVMLRLALPYLAVYLWNNTDDREEMERELSEEDRRRFHIILGRDESGRVQVTYLQPCDGGREERHGAIGAALEFAALDARDRVPAVEEARLGQLAGPRPEKQHRRDRAEPLAAEVSLRGTEHPLALGDVESHLLSDRDLRPAQSLERMVRELALVEEPGAERRDGVHVVAS